MDRCRILRDAAGNKHGTVEGLLLGGSRQCAGRDGTPVGRQLRGTTFWGDFSLGNTAGQYHRLDPDWGCLRTDGAQWPVDALPTLGPVLNVRRVRRVHDIFRL